MKIFEHLVVGPLQCNCYIVGDEATKEAIVIDPGGDADAIAAALAEQGLTVTVIVATHAHFDHIVAASRIRELTGAPFHMHSDDVPLLDWYGESGTLFLGQQLGEPPAVDTRPQEGDRLVSGAVQLEVMQTPGHSPGSISLVGRDVVFAGDTLFAGSVGRTDLPGGSGRALEDAIKGKLFELGDQVVVYPGHGPSTTIERERRDNPFVGARATMWLPG